uniref:Uncharacterized protein n=1 Tax=Rhizophora mucronata TaxID=61149 RepID=A0A2P2QBP0_RHIMU
MIGNCQTLHTPKLDESLSPPTWICFDHKNLLIVLSYISMVHQSSARQ